MAEAKHTQGVWSTRFFETYTVRDESEGLICTLHWLNGPCGLAGRRSADEVEANARLIAAAPELYAVCAKLRAALDALRPFPLVVEPVAAALIAEADAAIAKAESGS